MTTRSRAAGPVTRALLAALEDAAPQVDASEADVPHIRRIVNKLIEKARGGDLAAIKEIFDRIDGKAPSTAAGLDSEEPQKVIFEWKRDQ
jgi:ribosomal protein L17